MGSRESGSASTTAARTFTSCWWRFLIVAVAAVTVGLLGAGNAFALTVAGPEARVGATTLDRAYVVGVHECVSAGQRWGNATQRAETAAGSCVAAKAAETGVPLIKAGVGGGETAGKAFPQSVKVAAVEENLAATGGSAPVYVWRRMEAPNPQIDHAVPKSLGGDATHSNAQVACPHCDMSRGNGSNPVTPPSGCVGPWLPPWWPEK